MDRFEKEVRKALIDKDMSLNDLSNQLGICPAYIYDIFKGNRPGNKQKGRIVEILNLNPKILNLQERGKTDGSSKHGD